MLTRPARHLARTTSWDTVPEGAVEFDSLTRDWKSAFDAAFRALDCGRPSLSSQELDRRGNSLEIERAMTVELLQAVAHDQRGRPPNP